MSDWGPCKWCGLAMYRQHTRICNVRRDPANRNQHLPCEYAFLVEVYGYDDTRFEAESPAKARYAAFRAFREAIDYRMRFVDFLHRGVKVRPDPMSQNISSATK